MDTKLKSTWQVVHEVFLDLADRLSFRISRSNTWVYRQYEPDGNGFYCNFWRWVLALDAERPDRADMLMDDVLARDRERRERRHKAVPTCASIMRRIRRGLLKETSEALAVLDTCEMEEARDEDLAKWDTELEDVEREAGNARATIRAERRRREAVSLKERVR